MFSKQLQQTPKNAKQTKHYELTLFPPPPQPHAQTQPNSIRNGSWAQLVPVLTLGLRSIVLVGRQLGTVLGKDSVSLGSGCSSTPAHTQTHMYSTYTRMRPHAHTHTHTHTHAHTNTRTHTPDWGRGLAEGKMAPSYCHKPSTESERGHASCHT